jgi:hypothetical protein
MHRLLSALLLLTVGLAALPRAIGQDSVLGVDPLYPEFARPKEDASAAIEKRDLRFINIDRRGKVVPGAERYPRLVEIYGTKFIKQPFRIFASPSQNFSFGLRARAYADEYNRTVLRYLLEHWKE